jgi:hypothetical protein
MQPDRGTPGKLLEAGFVLIVVAACPPVARDCTIRRRVYRDRHDDNRPRKACGDVVT